MLNREQISCLVGYEFVEIDEAVEENAHLGDVLSQLGQCEVPFSG